ncbi:putative prolyl 4-hydroxylase [Dishui Lake phycodnavirus 4]|nr:putative prolyl 4-hydroxylase [Dishui Lake phycodnavirus 4]
MMYYIIIVLIVLVFFLIPTYKKPVVYKQLITEEERQHIMKVAESKLETSRIGSDKTVHTTIRDSETAWLSSDDPIVRRVIDKCISNCDRPFRNCEDLQVLRYKEGGFYKPHFDACSEREGCIPSEYSNQRKYTFIIALTDDYEGGSTSFPNLDKKYKMKAGDVLKFNNLDNYGLVCGQALHCGEPVTSGNKWICNLWVHTYPYKKEN